MDWMNGNTYTANLFGDVVDSLVSSADHHLVDDNLFRAQNDSILAQDSANGATETKSTKS